MIVFSDIVINTLVVNGSVYGQLANNQEGIELSFKHNTAGEFDFHE
jgi:cytoskeletal protein CcmA (bactofilin family)